MGKVIHLDIEQKNTHTIKALENDDKSFWEMLHADASPTLSLYTDGACSGNPGPGGWGAVFQYNNMIVEDFGGEPHTTNNRMEMLAAIKGLSKLNDLNKKCTVQLYTDSKYLRDGVQSWMPKWKKNGWQTADKKPVKNKDLWEILDALQHDHDITWHWVKGHDGDPLNEKADDLARSAVVRQALKSS